MNTGKEMYKQPIPIIRQETWSNLQSDLIKNITRSNIFQNCLNCTHWKYTEDKCGKFNAKPPAEIIVNSCPEYTDNNDIPF